ncbi:hypothetical protein ACET3Z_010723 [Daucus carota]
MTLDVESYTVTTIICGSHLEDIEIMFFGVEVAHSPIASNLPFKLLAHCPIQRQDGTCYILINIKKLLHLFTLRPKRTYAPFPSFYSFLDKFGFENRNKTSPLLISGRR